VPYDQNLAARIRTVVADEPDLTEKRMFGGVAFLINGNMAVSASGQGGLLLRVDPEQTDALIRETGASRAVMRGREMDGWLRVNTQAITAAALQRWIGVGLSYARSLPPK
jgi:TfoX/Sxy family transcriptional regulator of competence genes